MSYAISTIGSVISGSYWGRTHGSCRDMEPDPSSLPLITDATTFRVFFKDSAGLVSAASSNAAWPCGYRIYGGIDSAPVTSGAATANAAAAWSLLLCGGLLGLARRRRA